MEPLLISEILTRLLVALLLGSVLGLERNLAHKTAGMRTYGLVSLGAALFTLVSVEAGKMYIGFTDFDPLRMASQIIVGVGFLGGGIIFLKEGGINNLTTAAGLWVAAGIGIAAGIGFYMIAFSATVITFVVFTVLFYFEEKIKKAAERFEKQ